MGVGKSTDKNNSNKNESERDKEEGDRRKLQGGKVQYDNYVASVGKGESNTTMESPA